MHDPSRQLQCSWRQRVPGRAVAVFAPLRPDLPRPCCYQQQEIAKRGSAVSVSALHLSNWRLEPLIQPLEEPPDRAVSASVGEDPVASSIPQQPSCPQQRESLPDDPSLATPTSWSDFPSPPESRAPAAPAGLCPGEDCDCATEFLSIFSMSPPTGCPAVGECVPVIQCAVDVEPMGLDSSSTRSPPAVPCVVPKPLATTCPEDRSPADRSPGPFR